ncbi:MAG TPA: ABA4-like family protein [Polyangia bacterium]|nr:ABA4-like family protein [Polyangia bacterium]
MEKLVPFLFVAGGFTVMPFWLLMVFRPRWSLTSRVMRSPWVIAGPLAIYAALVVPRLPALLPVVARPDLGTIAAVLGTPLGATVAWMHFLALDLLAGRWIFMDARARGMPALVSAPILLLTLLFAPLGLLAYAVVRSRAGTTIFRWGAVEWGRLRRAHGPLALLTVGSAGLLIGSLLLGAFDHRQVLGAPVWLKPAKFGASGMMTAPVLAWILAQMPSARRLRLAGTIFAAVAALELALIAMQAARGVPSHFNFATGFDAAVFTLMGTSISLLWLAELYVAVRAFRHRFATPARTWAIRLGLAGALASGAAGALMARPTPDQVSAIRGGRPAPALGAHTVGAPDGGPGLPVTRWSRTGGDLRVPHFLGLHALQVLPLLALFLERRRRTAARPVAAAAVVWLGLFGVTLVQALRGQPLAAPDAVTWGLLAAVLLVGAGVLATGRLASARPRILHA